MQVLLWCIFQRTVLQSDHSQYWYTYWPTRRNKNITFYSLSLYSAHILSTVNKNSKPPQPSTLRDSLNLFIVEGNVLRLHLSYPLTTYWRHPDWLSRAYEVLTFSIAAAFRCRVARARGADTEETGTSPQIPVVPTECYNLTTYLWLFEDWNYFKFM
jgi:hypothetical protein